MLEIDESFEDLVDALEFYKLFYGEISRFRSLDFYIILKWSKPYVVKGKVSMTEDTKSGTLTTILDKLEI